MALEQIARTFGEEPKPSVHAAAQRALAGRQALIVLDGAEDADDLQSILEIRDRCCVLIKTRSRHPAPGGWQSLTPLPVDEAVELLQAWGGERARDEAAAPMICQFVGGLPLAVRLVGRYLAETDEDASVYLDWLEKTPLRALDQGQRRHESVPVLLARSVKQVSEPAQQALSVIGLLALAPFSRDIITASLNLNEEDARKALGDLVNYGLLLRKAKLYEISHALIHTYSRQHFVPSSKIVSRLAAFYLVYIQIQRKLGLDGFAQLEIERPHLVKLLAVLTERGEWQAILELSPSFEAYLDLSGHWTELIITIEAGIEAARKLGDRRYEGAWLGNLGNAYFSLGQVQRAIEFHQQALEIARETGDRRSEGAGLGNLGSAYYSLGQVTQAIEYYQQALAISREIGDRRGEGADLGNLGIVYSDLGQVEKAIEYYQQALAIFQEIGSELDEGKTLEKIGITYDEMRELEKAVDFYTDAIQVLPEGPDKAIVFRNRANSLIRMGQLEAAEEDCRQAEHLAHDHPYTHARWGQLHYARREHQTAVDRYHQAAALHSDSTEFNFDIALPLLCLGRAEEAITAIRARLEVHQLPSDLRGMLTEFEELQQQQPNLEGLAEALHLLRTAMPKTE